MLFWSTSARNDSTNPLLDAFSFGEAKLLLLPLPKSLLDPSPSIARRALEAALRGDAAVLGRSCGA